MNPTYQHISHHQPKDKPRGIPHHHHKISEAGHLVAVLGFWKKQGSTAVFDIRVTDTDSSSYHERKTHCLCSSPRSKTRRRISITRMPATKPTTTSLLLVSAPLMGWKAQRQLQLASNLPPGMLPSGTENTLKFVG